MKKLYIFLNNFLKTNDNVIDNNELEMNIDWSKTYGNLTSGKYRIIKRIYDGEYKYFSVEFDL